MSDNPGGLLGAVGAPAMRGGQGPHYVIGFNLAIDRLATTRLMSAVGILCEKGCSGITLCISSPGGAPDQVFYAYEILSRLPMGLITHNVGTTQSAAVVLFMAGQQRYCSPKATFLMHETTHAPLSGSIYGADQISLTAESIAADDERMASIISERSGQPIDTVRRWFRGQKLRDAQFAKQHGLIHDSKPVEVPPNSQFLQITL